MHGSRGGPTLQLLQRFFFVFFVKLMRGERIQTPLKAGTLVEGLDPLSPRWISVCSIFLKG